MQGDYYRYQAEFAHGEPRETYAKKASQAYEEGMEAAKGLLPTHPVRLGLALNFSVFQHEVLQTCDDAKKTANCALTQFDDARMQEPACVVDNDAELTKQLIMDNLNLWST